MSRSLWTQRRMHSSDPLERLVSHRVTDPIRRGSIGLCAQGSSGQMRFPERRPTDRRSAASNSADRTRPCHPSMPPDSNQGQLNRAVDGPLQRLVGHDPVEFAHAIRFAAQRIGVQRPAIVLTEPDPTDAVCRQTATKVKSTGLLLVRLQRLVGRRGWLPARRSPRKLVSRDEASPRSTLPRRFHQCEWRKFPDTRPPSLPATTQRTTPI